LSLLTLRKGTLMKRILLLSLLVASVVTWVGCSHFDKTSTRNVASVEFTPWAFDPGPNPNDKMGKELIDLVASQPNMPGISQQVLGSQKFRPAFGPTLWRMIQKPNSVKILFIGQDGTHIAEAAGRTATAGFGGRAQDMAAHFGVNTSAAFMNTYAFTIRKQYGVFSTPVIFEQNGKLDVEFPTVVDNGTWLMSQDLNSPMVKWRNGLIDWIIRNNKDSLKMIVLFGGSAQDSIGAFVESKGGKVGTMFSAEELASQKVKVPLFKSEGAGSNKIYPVMLDKNGRNFNYASILGRVPKFDDPKDQTEIIKAIEANLESVASQVSLPTSGVGGSGVAHPAQIGGYELTDININGQKTISLRGLPLSDGSKIENDILVAEFPHPTSLSMPGGDPNARVEAKMKPLKSFVAKNKSWFIEPDQGMTNKFANGQAYRYGRADLAPDYYDFGTPNNRMVSVSSASRMSGKPNVVVIGTREKAQFDMKQITAAENAKTDMSDISTDEMFNSRPRIPATRYAFDRGPSETMARIMKENLNLKNIKALNAVQTHIDDVGDFGHYRGTFANPKVVILADPDGVDDIVTSRALTGTRGQHLHGLMKHIGVNDQYLVIKTVPFGMDGAVKAQWTALLDETKDYRANVFKEIMKNGKPALIIADGNFASQEIEKLAAGVPFVKINRSGMDNNSGIAEAVAEIAAKSSFKKTSGALKMANIPRSHLGFFSRVWEGTSGTRVFTAISAADKGLAYAIVVPRWAASQKVVKQSPEEKRAVDALLQVMNGQKLPQNGEGVRSSRGGGGEDTTEMARPLNGVALADDSLVTSDNGAAEAASEDKVVPRKGKRKYIKHNQRVQEALQALDSN
jgi:hypothetical protein